MHPRARIRRGFRLCRGSLSSALFIRRKRCSLSKSLRPSRRVRTDRPGVRFPRSRVIRSRRHSPGRTPDIRRRVSRGKLRVIHSRTRRSALPAIPSPVSPRDPSNPSPRVPSSPASLSSVLRSRFPPEAPGRLSARSLCEKRHRFHLTQRQSPVIFTKDSAASLRTPRTPVHGTAVSAVRQA